MNSREFELEQAKKLIDSGISDEAREVLERQFPELLENKE